MSKNYHEITRISKFGRSSRGKEDVVGSVMQSTKFSKLTALVALSLFLLFGAMGASAQTVLIDPSADGGFESGSSGWTFVNDIENKWVVGTAAKKTGNNAIYVSNDGGVSNAYTMIPFSNVNQYSYFYKEIDIPEGESIINLKFSWKNNGENNDQLQVFCTDASVAPPVAGQTFVGSSVASLLRLKTDYTDQSYLLSPTFAGTRIRLIFQWQNDVGGSGLQPPASVDDISLISRKPSTVSSVRSGLFSSPDTWAGGIVPNIQDSFVIEKSHAVAIDVTGLRFQNATIKGILKYSSLSSSAKEFFIAGDLKIENGGSFIMHDGQFGQIVNVAGNLINDGTIDNTVNASSTQGFVFNGASPQTISGTGSFGPYLTCLRFNNTSPEVPNIYLNVNNLVVAGTLDFANGKVKLPEGYKISLGTAETVAAMAANGYAAIPTLSLPSAGGVGFLPGVKFSRYFQKVASPPIAANAGSAIVAGVNPVMSAAVYSGMFPFITESKINRSLFLRRSNADYTANQIVVEYTDTPSVTSGLTIADGSYTINKRLDSNWAVTTDGITSANTYQIAVMADSGLYPLDNSTRLMYANGAFAPTATHQNASLTPCVQRIGLSESDLTGHGSLYVGITDTQSMVYSVKNGPWEDASTWSNGEAPTSTDRIVVSAGTTVTVTEGGNSCLSLTVSAAGNLVFKQGVDTDLTVGTSANKTSRVIVNGRLTINNGADFKIYGGLLSNFGSEFIQNGGEITVDGNTGTAGTSIPTGGPLVNFNSNSEDGIQLNGGKLIIANPHIGSNAGQDRVLYINQTIAGSASPNHTVQFGDGVSDLKNTTNGFLVVVSNTRFYSLGKVVVDGREATGRFVAFANGGTLPIAGDLEILADGQLRSLGTGASHLYVGGNIKNDGILTVTGTLGFALQGDALIPASTASTVSGTGIFRNVNLPATPTAMLTNLLINNTAGVTLNLPFSMSGNLTLTNGVLNVSGLTMTSTVATAVIGGNDTSYVNGIVTRSIANANPNSTYYQFPVGTATGYAPIWLAPASTAVLTASAQAFDTNAGTGGSSTRSWVAPITGNFTNLNVRIGGVSITASSLPVLAPTANGTYTAAFDTTSAFTSGIVSTVQSISSVLAANYKGYVSYSNAAVLPADCTGTPTPGNVVSTANELSLGDTVKLSLTNAISGEKVSYLWQQSTNGTDYTDIPWATASTYSVKPIASTWYRCKVTCGASSNTGTSGSLQITFKNSVTANTPASRCGYGTVNLNATGNVGSTINWYDSVEGGKLLGSGSSFTTPNIDKTTKFYASAETIAPGTFTAGPATYVGTPSATTGFAQYFSSVNAVTLVSVDVFPNFADTPSPFEIYGPDTSPGVRGTLLLSKNITFTQQQVDAAKAGVPVTVDLNFLVPAGAKGYVLSYTKSIYYSFVRGAYIFPMTHSGFSITGPTAAEDGSNNDNNSSKFYYFNWRVQSAAQLYSSARVAVEAKVNESSPITLSSESVTICRGGSVQVSLTSPVVNYDTYTWTPSTGVTGSATTGWTFNPATSTTYKLVGTKGDCQYAVDFDVIAGPKADPVQKVCATIYNGSSAFVSPTIANLTPASSATVKWYSSNAVDAEVLTSSSLLVDGTTYYVAQMLDCGESSRTPVQVEFNVVTPPTGVSPQSICSSTARVNDSPSAVSLTVPDESVVRWYRNGVRITSATTAWANSNYLATAMIDGCESSPFEISIHVLTAVPTGVSGMATQKVCGATGTVADLAVNEIAMGLPIKWYDAPTGGTPYSSSDVLTNNGKYYAAINSTAVDATCPENTTTRFLVTATTNGTLSLAAITSPVCEGTTALSKPLPNIVGGVMGTWSPASLPVTGITQTTDFVFTSSTCGSMTRTIVVTPAPVAPAAVAVQDICNAVPVPNFASLNPPAVANSVIYFTGPGPLDGFRNPTNPIATGTYYIGAVVNGCNSVVRTPVTINLIAAPAPEALPQVFCNTTATVSMLTATGTGIKWYATVNGITPLLPTDVLTTKSYFAEQEVSGCNSVRKNVNVVVGTTAAPEVVGSYTFCNVVEAVSALSASGELVKWYDSVDGSPLEVITDLTSGNYYATQTWFECESQKSSPVSVTVNIVAAPSGIAAQTVNAGATIAALSVTGTDVVWYASEGNALDGVSPLTSTTELVDGVYYAMQSMNECRSTAPLAVTVTVTPTLGVGQFDIAGLQFYPNPVVDYINISNTSDITSVRVFNMLGQGVMTVRPSVTTAKIDMSALPMGTYLMEVQSEGKTAKFKVIKNQ